jgi:surface antigen
MAALDSGAPDVPVSWRNPDSGRYGTVVPGPAYERNGRRCRAYTHTVTIDNRPQTVRRAACRNADGGWSPLD